MFICAYMFGLNMRSLSHTHTGQLGSMTPGDIQKWRVARELDERNKPMSDEELDAIFPQEGYKVMCAVFFFLWW